MAFDSMLQRHVMGRFATGVTLLTTQFDEGILGMTANAVMSLSLEPPLIVVAVDKENSMHECLTQGRVFRSKYAARGPGRDFASIRRLGPKRFFRIRVDRGRDRRSHSN